MKDEYLKVGELARRSGVSVRTLHHYDEIGLLSPALGGHGSHRLYGRAEIERLRHIRSLVALGLSLAEVRDCLDDPRFAPLPAIEAHLERLRREERDVRRLRDRLEAIARSLRAAETPSVDELLQEIEVVNEMEAFEKYYTPEQLEYLKERRTEVGEDRIQAVQQEWQELFASYREAMERGDDPASEAVQALARKAHALVEEFTGGNAGVRESLGKMYADSPETPSRFGVEPALWEYMGRAAKAWEESC